MRMTIIKISRVRGVLGGAAILAATLLFSPAAVAAPEFQVTNASGTVTYGGVDVTTTSAGATTLAATCTAPLHFQLLNTGSSFTFTFSTPVASVRLPHINSPGGTLTTTQFVVNGTPVTLAGGNITGTDNQCLDPTLNVIVGGNLTNSGAVSAFPNSQIEIPGPITTLTVQDLGGTNTSAFQLFFPAPIIVVPALSAAPLALLTLGFGGVGVIAIRRRRPELRRPRRAA